MKENLHCFDWYLTNFSSVLLPSSGSYTMLWLEGTHGLRGHFQRDTFLFSKME